MSSFYYLVSLFFIIFIGYSLGRKYLFIGRNTAGIIAFIDKITLQDIDDLWSPDVEIFYSFNLQDRVYSGRDFLRIDEFFPNDNILLTSTNGFPVLELHGDAITGEEHIETLLLERIDEIPIEYNKDDPEENRIYKGEGKENLFQDISIRFPWLT